MVLTGSIGNRAILVVNGSAPKTVAPGESFHGVRLISLSGDDALVDAGGERIALRMGAPINVGGSTATSGRGKRIVLPATSGGHFVTLGAINGRAVNFMVDTGATAVAMSAADAERIGLDYKSGNPVRMRTANGDARGWRVQLDSVQVGDVAVTGVEAVVSPQPMPYVLLGNSFISRFSMRRESDQMVLEKRF